MTALNLKCSQVFFIYLFKGFKAILVKAPNSYNDDKNKRKGDKSRDYCGAGYIYIDMTYRLHSPVYKMQVICVQFNLKCQGTQSTHF